MSRLFAKYLMETYGKGADDIASIFANTDITIRYFKTTNQYEFKVLDFFTLNSFYNVKIDEVDLLRMLKIDSYSEDEKNELYYHKLLTEYEQVDLDDDTFYGISLLQYFFYVSPAVLRQSKKQYHLFRLRRTNSASLCLKTRKMHSNGGRKVGSITLTEADKQNIENKERIIRNCVEKDRFQEFMELYRLLIRTHNTKLTITKAKWKFYELRYRFKLERGLIERDVEYENELSRKLS